jgi:hypothetical protein
MAATNILMAYPTTEKEDLDYLLEDPDLEEEEEEEEDDEDEDDFEGSKLEEEDASVSDGDDFDANEAATDAAADAAADAADAADAAGEGEVNRRRRMPRRIRVPGGLVHSAVALRQGLTLFPFSLFPLFKP